MNPVECVATALQAVPRVRLATLPTPRPYAMPIGGSTPIGALGIDVGVDDAPAELAGLLGLAAEGRFPAGSTVVFWHTGGTPAVFAPGGAPLTNATANVEVLA